MNNPPKHPTDVVYREISTTDTLIEQEVSKTRVIDTFQTMLRQLWVAAFVGSICIQMIVATINNNTLRAIFCVLFTSVMFGWCFYQIKNHIELKLVYRIQRIATRTVEISNGEIHKSLRGKGNDEISELANGIERMRRSIQIAMEMNQRG